MPIFKCSYAYDVPCYADFTFEADTKEQAQLKLEEMLTRGCFENVTADPYWENAPENERVFISGESKVDDEPLSDLERFNPKPGKP